jgi:hypothetical protein
VERSTAPNRRFLVAIPDWYMAPLEPLFRKLLGTTGLPDMEQQQEILIIPYIRAIVSSAVRSDTGYELLNGRCVWKSKLTSARSSTIVEATPGSRSSQGNDLGAVQIRLLKITGWIQPRMKWLGQFAPLVVWITAFRGVEGILIGGLIIRQRKSGDCKMLSHLFNPVEDKASVKRREECALPRLCSRALPREG